MGNYSQIGVTRLREAYRGLREEVGYFGGTGLMFCSFAFLVFAEERPHPSYGGSQYTIDFHVLGVDRVPYTWW